MASKNRESLLWQKVKKALSESFLTRIESSTINGIPDVHGVHKHGVYWIELKSDDLSYPKLNKWQIVWINRYIKAGGTVFILKETPSHSRSSFLVLGHRSVVTAAGPAGSGTGSSGSVILVLVSRPLFFTS